jgi:hypothetical protein
MMIRLKLSKASVFTALALLSGVAIALGQRVEHKPLPTEPLEKYGDPPAYIWQTGVSPKMISVHDAFTSVQVNVDANGHNITGDAANEPSISVDPTDGNKMTIGWRQFNNVSSNFRQAGWGFTTDGGASWTFPGVLENNVFRSDPVLDSDDSGNFFYLSLLETFFDNMWRSLDGGQSWTNIANADGGDKQWFTIDNTNSTGHGFQYQDWSTAGNNFGGRQFTRSTDGGFTWLNPINIPHSPIWGTLDVDSTGNLFLGGTNGQIWCIRSTNAKNGAVTPSFDQSTSVNLGGDIVSSEPINPAGLVGQVFLAADRSGTSTNDNIYILASVQPTGFNKGSDVMFARSTDNGATFSAPIRVNDDPVNHNKWHWLGTLAVAPNGRIDSVWLDTRNAANNTWSPNVAVSNSFNPFLGYPDQNKMGDYITIVSDNDGGNVAYAATFNLEEDVYYVRVTPSSQGTQLVSAASRLTHGSAGTFDVAMPLTGTSGVEDRSASTYNAVFNFNAAVTSGEVLVVGGTATVGTISFSGNTMTAQLTGVTVAEVVTLRVQNINGDGLQHGDIPFGFLTGDANANRRVDKPDQTQVQGQLNQTVTSANFRDDLNVDGRIRNNDVQIVRANKNHSIP